MVPVDEEEAMGGGVWDGDGGWSGRETEPTNPKP